MKSFICSTPPRFRSNPADHRDLGTPDAAAAGLRRFRSPDPPKVAAPRNGPTRRHRARSRYQSNASLPTHRTVGRLAKVSLRWRARWTYGIGGQPFGFPQMRSPGEAS